MIQMIDDSKMVFKIEEKKSNISHDTNIPVPLLPPPPSPSSQKNIKKQVMMLVHHHQKQIMKMIDDPLQYFVQNLLKIKQINNKEKILLQIGMKDETNNK